ncbi:MAG: GAF domain-containing protein [Anaerolineae bacterium]|nr:GAF domain-containing protein [Anaerolineae bacterium]
MPEEINDNKNAAVGIASDNGGENNLPADKRTDSFSADNSALLSLVTSCITLPVLAIIILALLQQPVWQLYVSVGALITVNLTAWLNWIFARRNRAQIGIGILLGVFFLVSLFIGFVINDLYIALALAVIAITLLLTGQSLKERASNRIIIAGVFVASIIVLQTLFTPWPRFNLPATISQWLPVLDVGLLLVLFIIVVYQFRNYKLRTKLLVAFTGLSLLAIAGELIYYTSSTEKILTDNASAVLLDAAQQTASSIDGFVNRNLDAIRAESRIPVFVHFLTEDSYLSHDGLVDNTNAVLRALSLKDPIYINSYALLNRAGVVVADTFTLDIGLDKSDREYFQLAVESGVPYVSQVRFEDQHPFLYFSSPVRDAGGNIIGVLVARYNAAILQRLVAQNNGLAGRESSSILLDEHRIVIAHGVSPELNYKSLVPLSQVQLNALQAAEILPSGTSEELSLGLVNLDAGVQNANAIPVFQAEAHEIGAAHIDQVAVRPVKSKGLDWYVAFVQPQEVFLSPIRAQTQNTLGFAFVISAGAMALALWIAHFLASPLTRLTQIAKTVAGGNLDTLAQIESQDEIGILATTFNSMTRRLKVTLDTLEDLVAVRTAALEQRSRYLEASSEVGRAVSSELDPEVLIANVVDLIQEHFDLYYVGLYLVDDRREWADLRAGTGSAGQAMLARQHRLLVEESSVVGWCIIHDQSRIIQDITMDKVYQGMPELPDTKSESVLPLRARGRVIGALVVESTESSFFESDIVSVLQIMADQVATALETARLFAENQEALEATSRVYGELNRQAWAELLHSSRNLAVQSDGRGVHVLHDLPEHSPGDIDAAVSQVTPPGDAEVPDSSRISIPIKGLGGVIGTIETRKPQDMGTWTTEEMNLLEELTDRLAQALDGARLYQDTQRSAIREQLTGEITANIRAEVEVEALLTKALEELGRALGAKRATVQLEVEE